MPNLERFISENSQRSGKTNIGEICIEGKKTFMTPIKQVTVQHLLNELEKGSNPDNTYIFINYNNINTDLKTIKNKEDLEEYFGREIKKLFCIEDKNGTTYYNVTIKPNIEDVQQKLKSFELTYLKESNNFLGIHGKDSGKIYKITPQKPKTTIRNPIKEMKTIQDENLLINIESPELEDTDYKDIENIPEEYLNLEIRDGSILFGKKHTYFIITGFTQKLKQTA